MGDGIVNGHERGDYSIIFIVYMFLDYSYNAFVRNHDTITLLCTVLLEISHFFIFNFSLIGCGNVVTISL